MAGDKNEGGSNNYEPITDDGAELRLRGNNAPDDIDDDDDIFGDDLDDDFDGDDGNGEDIDGELFEDEIGDDADFLESLFDDEDGEGNKPSSNLERLIAALQGNVKPNDTNNNEPGNNEEQFNAFVDDIYGDGLDVSFLFDSSNATNEEIENANKQFNDMFKPLMSRMVRRVMETSLNLANEQVTGILEKQSKERSAETRRNDVKTAIMNRMPFLKQPEHRVMFDQLYGGIYDKANGDAKKTLKVIEKLYRKTNPRLFSNGGSRSFQKPNARKSRKLTMKDFGL